MIERHQDYIATIPSLPAGGGGLYQLQLDTDAPFLCRGRGLHLTPPSTTRSQGPINAEMRFGWKNAARNDFQTIPIQTPVSFAGAYGQGAQYRPVFPQEPYQPGQIIEFELYNDSATNLTNVQMIFRGVKLFRDGALPTPTYPSGKFRPLDFTYQTGKGTVTDQAIVLATTATLRQNIFQVQGDADFVLRAGQAGLWDAEGDGTYSSNGYTELYIQLFDAYLKPYSNVPIHIDWLFGNAGGGSDPNFIALGNAAPGLLFPEIYLRKNETLFYDLFRNDSAYVPIADDLPVRISIAWIGGKIYS